MSFKPFKGVTSDQWLNVGKDIIGIFSGRKTPKEVADKFEKQTGSGWTYGDKPQPQPNYTLYALIGIALFLLINK